MKNYEYKQVQSGETQAFVSELNRLGKQGYRVIGYQVFVNPLGDVPSALLEREVPEPQDDDPNDDIDIAHYRK